MSKGVDVHQEVDEPVHDVLVLVLVLVDGGLVDEHVVVVLAEDHEVVTDWREVVAFL